MATRVTYEVHDDLTGEPGAKTVFFSLGTQVYEIDLVDGESRLAEVLAPFIAAGRKSASQRMRRTPAQAATEERAAYNQQVRQWAHSNGLKVSKRGRISEDLIRQFEESRQRHGGKRA